jgi:predicted  nucleic acid-binding Zn-ribbon protein
MPFNPADFKPGVGVSERSIERLATRVEELKNTRSQLATKMRSIDARLADPAEAANSATLREAKQALERSTKQLELEEQALADFLRNEREGAPPSP